MSPKGIFSYILIWTSSEFLITIITWLPFSVITHYIIIFFSTPFFVMWAKRRRRRRLTRCRLYGIVIVVLVNCLVKVVEGAGIAILLMEGGGELWMVDDGDIFVAIAQFFWVFRLITWGQHLRVATMTSKWMQQRKQNFKRHVDSQQHTNAKEFLAIFVHATGNRRKNETDTPLQIPLQMVTDSQHCSVVFVWVGRALSGWLQF